MPRRKTIPRSYARHESNQPQPATPLAATVGDTVAYTAAFLRNTGQITGEAGQRRGILKELVHYPAFLGDKGPPRFAKVLWNDAEDGEVTLVNLCNLAHVGPNTRYCAQ